MGLNLVRAFSICPRLAEGSGWTHELASEEPVFEESALIPVQPEKDTVPYTFRVILQQHNMTLHGKKLQLKHRIVSNAGL